MTTLPLGVTGVMLPELDLAEQLSVCAELGLTHYVIRPRVIADKAVGQPYHSHGNHKFDLTPTRFAERGAAIGEQIRAAGLVPFCTVPQENADAPDESHELNFRGAAAAGFTRVKITPINYPKELFDYPEYLKRAVARYRALCDLAKPYNLKVIIEMHQGNGASSPGLARLMLQPFDPAELGVIVDLPNYAREGFVEPRLALSVLEPWIDHVHLGGLRLVKGERDELGYVKTWGEMCALVDADLHIPTWLGLLSRLGREVPLIIEDYEKGMTGEEKLRRAVKQVTPVLEGLGDGCKDAALNEHGLPGSYRPDPDWEVTPRQVRAWREAGEAVVLLDVRMPQEVAAAAVEGATLVPMGEVPARLPELEEYAEQRVVVMCHHGQRSMQVTAFLRQQGFEDVRSMAGGIDAWSLGVDPAVPRY